MVGEIAEIEEDARRVVAIAVVVPVVTEVENAVIGDPAANGAWTARRKSISIS